MKSAGTRLALWYAGVSTATLALLFIAGYYLLRQHLINGLDLLNRAEFEQIRSALGPAPDALPPDVFAARIRRTLEPASVLFYLQVRQPGHGELYTSENLQGRRLPGAATPGEQNFSVAIEGIDELRAGAYALGPREFLIATPLTPVRRLMDGYTQTSLVLVCLMLVSSVILGFVLSRAALRPVRVIRETANRIRSDHLSERIPVQPDARDEISSLARLLNEMFDRLESAFLQIRRFAAEASHELKTPLSLVRLQAEKLLVERGLTPAQEEAVQVQLEEIARLNQIIEDLLFLSRAEAQAIKLELRHEDPRAFLESFVQDARLLAEQRSLVFDRVECIGTGAAAFDPKWLRQVLFNLLQNALNVSPPGGRVTLTSDITVDAWVVALTDEGPGVPPEQRERIFDRFVRLAPASGEPAPGSGLGLAISRSIVHLHQGTMRAEAGPHGRGLRVVFSLPRASPPSGRAPAARPRPPVELHAE